MTKKSIKYSCLILCLICMAFLSVTAVFAATQQTSSILTKVSYTPSLNAVVQISTDNGSTYTTLFNNSSDTSYTVTTTTPSFSSGTQIKFKVINMTTDKAITAVVRLATSSDGVTLPTSTVTLCDESNNAIANNSLDINIKDSSTVSNIAENSSTDPYYAESDTFHVQTYFAETVTFIVELKEV